MSIELQKDVADLVLDRIESFDPSCIVAGGAPRDWSFEKEASDIDVFFFYRESSTLREVKFLLSKAFPEYKFELRAGLNFNEEDDSEYKKNPSLHRVFQTEVNGVKVQLMQMRKPTWISVIDEFPLSICKVWYKRGRIKATNEFNRSVANKAIIKTNIIYADRDKYVKKILTKFPDFKYYRSYEEFFKRN